MPKTPPPPELSLPTIKLKYFSRLSRSAPPSPEMRKHCYICKERIVRLGGVYRAHTKRPVFVCEDCAIWNYKYDYGFRTKKAAAARRRRIFDVGYLVHEMVLDAYCKRIGIEDVSSIPPDIGQELTAIAAELYNQLFSKEEKIMLEETWNQEEIERRLRNQILKNPAGRRILG